MNFPVILIIEKIKCFNCFSNCYKFAWDVSLGCCRVLEMSDLPDNGLRDISLPQIKDFGLQATIAATAAGTMAGAFKNDRHIPGNGKVAVITQTGDFSYY